MSYFNFKDAQYDFFLKKGLFLLQTSMSKEIATVLTYRVHENHLEGLLKC